MSWNASRLQRCSTSPEGTGNRADKVVEVDPEREFPGAVYRVPDSWWGFHAEDRVEHPGLCVLYQPATRKSQMLQGGSFDEKSRLTLASVLIEPDGENGLTAPTVFQLEPRSFRYGRMLLLHSGPRQLGRLSARELDLIQRKMAWLFYDTLKSDVK